ncbi:hypothetical protein LEP1GSC047_1870 [Leptospira inadai serovar Lyme str. 10]|uniref:Uncharacterized protein n=2 Tax=Leptospira inadai serovar Lyme TaxID=293084 RepID=V6H8U3_9LEPT|nr:hypothetical protein [Leptospira inadai]EQA35252.1 hypothetical protein LEP1GSC047_1870 [Leptospira inadai serovar Lyme str. 10]PNV73685.1 hypothetical protein BES34_016695 [Leptospira inadai serovar Lyme]
MSATSRTDAHKVFADLYRKPRSPEHQQKIDEVIQKSNDIFIRIDLMKKVDEEFEQKKREDNRRTEEDEKAAKQGTSTSGSSTSSKTPPKPVRKTNDAGGVGLGFLANLFGGNAAVSKFAKETGTVEVGFLGRNSRIAPSVERLFKALKEDQIISTLQALRLAESQGWRHWRPLVYNVVLNFNKFFNNFISLDSLFIDEISPEIFLNRSLKMQMYYARHLSRDDAKDIILTHLPELVKKDEKLSVKLPSILSGLNYGLNLETGRPKLTDAIRAFYVVSNRKVITWEEIIDSLNVPPINEMKFQGSPDITKEVDTTLIKLSDDIITRGNKKEELQNLRQRYFKIDENGKISFDFLNGVVDDYFAHHMPENMNSAAFKSSFKGMPHKLIYILLRDFQSCYSPILEGMVKIGTKNHNRDVIIMQTGLFKGEIEEINNLLRQLDAFNKKYPSFQYTFATFNQNTSGSAVEDQITLNLLRLLGEASAFMGKFAEKINVLVENHLLAKDYEAKNQLNDRVLASKEKVIDEIKVLHRFIPYYDSTIVSGNRLNNKTLEYVFVDMAQLLFNYAVIYKDKFTVNKLTAHRKIDAELKALRDEYERLSGKPFVGSVMQNVSSEEV